MLRLTGCGCGTGQLVRINRSFWMKLWPRRRLYYCAKCGTRQWLRRLPAWMLPPQPSQPPRASRFPLAAHR